MQQQAFLDILDWIESYHRDLPTLPVNPSTRPGDVLKLLPVSAPDQAESFDAIFADFQGQILPNMTHWQHPDFYAYFPASNSEASLQGELLTAALGAQCMLWATSPAAEELEIRMMQWLRELLDLPKDFTGCIQDTASSATLCALITAREVFSNYQINQSGFQGQRLRVYASSQVHSSADKAVRICGIGQENLVKIEVDEHYAMIPEALEAAIQADLEKGYQPLAIIATIGSTSTTAVDPIEAIGHIAEKYQVWLHVDAAYAGSALILPECRWMSKGLEKAQSFVFNPHKWLFTHFDCSAYFVKDPMALRKTFGIQPAYLQTAVDEQVANFRDWGIALGRRFRALKLWFVLRSFGAGGLRERLRYHISLGQWLREAVEQAPDFELMAPVPLNLVCFRYHHAGIDDSQALNQLNQKLLAALNSSGKAFVTPTELRGQYSIRIVAGNSQSNLASLERAWGLVQDLARAL